MFNFSPTVTAQHLLYLCFASALGFREVFFAGVTSGLADSSTFSGFAKFISSGLRPTNLQAMLHRL